MARRWSMLIGTLAVLVVSFALVGPQATAAQEATPPADGTPAAEIPGVETFEIESNLHEEGPIDYAQQPPVGGPHNPVWQDCGFYDAPVGNEHAVHSLEHGAVWITYAPDLPAAEVATLRALAAGELYLLVSPYPDLPTPVVASTWDKQLRLESADDPRLIAFIAAFAGKGPEAGSTCFGGTTETLAPTETPTA